ncbi:hypothetical protein NIES2119_27475 [[Phormidium ambiguum] IAM M-71]|uniref:Uncharacterized protein n=1 Tax=[Phormidium ambiguum] IAM M-71 TaxID=454136 RepID=A0A1U7I6K8_9CYAN|nr:hypothetical protein [Phormidium ambiguum]OKH31968.1 hypothetical protein NIES2119_27475 [Phormidium ambiguum IAM M-71]
MATKTVSNRNRNQGNYITPHTPEGAKILKYLRNRCEKALDYCLENGLKSVEDFADTVEELTEADGKPSINVEIKHNGIILSLADRPEYGSTTGKYMMEHLGESDDNRFTKTGVEAILNPQKSYRKSQQDDLLNDLDDDEPQVLSKSKLNSKTYHSDIPGLDENELFTKTQNQRKAKSNDSDELALEEHQTKSKSKNQSRTDELDDLLDELDENEPQTKPQSKAKNQPQKDAVESDEISDSSKDNRKSVRNPLLDESQSPTNNQRQSSNNLDIDNILDATSQVSSRAATSGSEVDGTTLGGLSTQIAVLTTLIGKKAASQVLEAAKATGRERQVSNIIKRLKAQSQRADSLTTRVKTLTQEESDESETPTDSPMIMEESNSKDKVESVPDAGVILAEAVNKINDKIDKTSIALESDTSEKSATINIDTKASFDKQLAQINQALDRLEKRLDTLEVRLEALEQKLFLTETKINESVVEPDNDLNSNNSKPSPLKLANMDNTNGKKAAKSPSIETQSSQIAPLLAQLYNLVEEEAVAAGETLEDGVELGSSKLYQTHQHNSTSVRLENQRGEELFSASCSQGQWKVINDFLSKEDKQEIADLDLLQRTIHQETLAEVLGKSGLTQMNFTNSQGRRFDFEVEFSDKSKSSASIQGFNQYDEVVFDATIARGKVEVLQCDIPIDDVKYLLSQKQQIMTPHQHKEQKTELEMEA